MVLRKDRGMSLKARVKMKGLSQIPEFPCKSSFPTQYDHPNLGSIDVKIYLFWLSVRDSILLLRHVVVMPSLAFSQK